MDLRCEMDAGIDRRLENWGRWAKDHAPNRPSRSSPLYRLIREANPEMVIGEAGAPVVDPEDAWKVEKAIARVCLQYERLILKEWYIKHEKPGIICRRCGLVPHSLERELGAIQRKLSLELSA